MFVGFVALGGVLAAILNALDVQDIDESLANIDASGMKGNSVCTYTNYVTGLMPYGFRITPAEGYSDFTKCLAMLKNGEVDAVAYDEPALQTIRRSDADFEFFAIGDNYQDFDMTAAMPRNSAVKDAVNIAVLTVLKDQDWMDKTSGTYFGDGTPPTVLAKGGVPWALLATTIGVVFIFGVLQFWPIKLEQRHPDKVRRKQSLLNKNKEEVNDFFKSADTDGDGMFNLKEAKAEGMDLATFREIDANGNGKLTKLEFEKWQEREGGGVQQGDENGGTVHYHKHNKVGPTPRALPPVKFADGKAAEAGPQQQELPPVRSGKQGAKERMRANPAEHLEEESV